jgi:signal transduction histidine kinase
MKSKLTTLSRQYQAALGQHLKQGPQASSQPARRLGRQSLALGLETLDFAKVHEQAVLELVLPNGSQSARADLLRRAGTFFAEAITPIEATHRTAQETNLHLDQLNQALRRRTADLASSNLRLKREITQRKLAENSFRKSEKHFGELLRKSQQMQEQLRHLSRQLLSAQEEERKRISRELHDVIAQTLSGINVRLAALKNATTLNSEGLEENIVRTQQLVQESVEIVHRFARELRPTVLDDLGIIPALHTFMKGFKEETGIRVSLSAFGAVEQVNGDKRTVLYRVAQEALTNVARHAQASEAQVRIQQRNGSVLMKIKDNGKGFHQERSWHLKKGKRLGLLGMRERVEMVGGNFTFTSAPGQGTTVLAQIPLMNGAVGGGVEEAKLLGPK